MQNETVEKAVVCICCPIGCQTTVYLDRERKTLKIKGAQCKDGLEFIREELTAPSRVLTTTVRLEGGGTLPVRTSKPVAKDLLLDCVRSLAQIQVKPPVGYHSVVLANICNTGTDVIATREIELP